MKGWKLFLLIVLGFIAVAIIAGAFLAPLLFAPGKVVSPPPRGPVAQVTQSPSEVVKSYLSALEGKDYRTAYSHLSRESKARHSYDEFASLNETKGITEYDLSTAKEEQGDDGYMTVAVQLKEDPATAGIRVVKEGGEWKVVFLEGIPSYPYP